MATPREGYVFHSYGAERYVKHAVASVRTLRRHDAKRPVALFCPPDHQALLARHGLSGHFDRIAELPPDHRSIVGFKHHLDRFKAFERSLFVDADMVWCRDPDPLWHRFATYAFTATGLQQADHFFGGPKGPGVLADILLSRRRQTLERLGLTYRPRVQAGMVYAQDDACTAEVMQAARHFLGRAGETHFRSRLQEDGRSEESCEWSLALAMSQLDRPVFPWLQGQESPQLDYIDGLTTHDPAFREVSYRLYTSPFVYSLRGLPAPQVRDALLALAEQLPGLGEYMTVTPFALHFGWLHQKQPFYDFVDRTWSQLTVEGNRAPGSVSTTDHTSPSG
jgi:hypothetical protein